MCCSELHVQWARPEGLEPARGRRRCFSRSFCSVEDRTAQPGGHGRCLAEGRRFLRAGGGAYAGWGACVAASATSGLGGGGLDVGGEACLL